MAYNKSISQLLREWGFPSFVHIFEEQEIDIDALKLITKEDIMQLVPDIKIGPLNKLLNKLVYFASEVNSEEATLKLVQNGSPPGDLLNNSSINEQVDKDNIENEFNLEVAQASIIWKYIKGIGGQSIMKVFEKTKRLSRQLRLELANIVVLGEMDDDPSHVITPQRFKELAVRICTVFPGMTKETFYMPRAVTAYGETAPKGCLYNKYINEIRKFRARGIRDGGRNHSADVTERIMTNKESEAVEWLKNYVEPWQYVLSNWKCTTDVRLHELRTSDLPPKKNKRAKIVPPLKEGTSITSYFNCYRALRLSQGYTLLEEDFHKMYPNSALHLLNNWPKFVTVLQSITNYQDDDDLNHLTSKTVQQSFQW